MDTIKLKSAEDYMSDHFSFVDEYDIWKNIIKEAQRNAIEYTLKVASENVDTGVTWIKDGEEFDYTDVLADENVNYEVYVINSSITGLKETIFKDNNL